MRFQCWKCHAVVEVGENRVGLRDTCAQCDTDLHACRNCKFYDPGKHNQCAEPQAEWVRDKESANHCDYFFPHSELNARSQPFSVSQSDEAKKRFDSLFKA
jgi:hypothetical protein